MQILDWALSLFLIAVSTMTQLANDVDYTIEAIHYGTIPQFPMTILMVGSSEGEKLDIPLMFWLVRGGGRTALLDTGCHRKAWLDQYDVTDFIRPDNVLRLAGIDPGQVTDIILSHLHWDHAGGIDLFPKAIFWIQESEFAYYTGPAWQEDGRHHAIDPEDLVSLLRLNTQGRLRLIAGDDIEVMPGIRVYTGGRHTYASQYVRIEGPPSFVLASDNCYLYRNLETRSPIKTFEPADYASNLAALDRMVSLAGARDRVIPGHDPRLFRLYPSVGRLAKIK